MPTADLATHPADTSLDLRYGTPVHRDGDRATIELAGELDIETTPRLATLLAELVNEGVDDITVDLAAVTLLETTTLRALLGTHARLAPRGGRLRLRHPSSAALRVLHATRTAFLLDDE